MDRVAKKAVVLAAMYFGAACGGYDTITERHDGGRGGARVDNAAAVSAATNVMGSVGPSGSGGQTAGAGGEGGGNPDDSGSGGVGGSPPVLDGSTVDAASDVLRDRAPGDAAPETSAARDSGVD